MLSVLWQFLFMISKLKLNIYIFQGIEIPGSDVAKGFWLQKHHKHARWKWLHLKVRSADMNQSYKVKKKSCELVPTLYITHSIHNRKLLCYWTQQLDIHRVKEK